MIIESVLYKIEISQYDYPLEGDPLGYTYV
jgi:hypothetical protein